MRNQRQVLLLCVYFVNFIEFLRPRMVRDESASIDTRKFVICCWTSLNETSQLYNHEYLVSNMNLE
jgi:hypothetical protein